MLLIRGVGEEGEERRGGGDGEKKEERERLWQWSRCRQTREAGLEFQLCRRSVGTSVKHSLTDRERKKEGERERERERC